MDFWWLSFVKDHVFAGGCIVQAVGPGEAIQEAWFQGCNPGGEVMAIRIPAENKAKVKPDELNRLLSRAEWEAKHGPGKTVGDIMEEQRTAELN